MSVQDFHFGPLRQQTLIAKHKPCQHMVWGYAGRAFVVVDETVIGTCISILLCNTDGHSASEKLLLKLSVQVHPKAAGRKRKHGANEHTERPPPLGMDTFGNQFSISLANLQKRCVNRSQGSCRGLGRVCTEDLPNSLRTQHSPRLGITASGKVASEKALLCSPRLLSLPQVRLSSCPRLSR